MTRPLLFIIIIMSAVYLTACGSSSGWGTQPEIPAIPVL